jgi:uncharacterized protein (TIGR02246 family)
MESSKTIPPKKDKGGEANKNFSIWSKTLLTRDPARVAELYTDDSTFLPTVSGEFKKGKAGASEYFRHFLEKFPAGYVVEEEVQQLGEGFYLHSGMYNFELGPENQRQTVEARFSFVWRREPQGEWRIIHHHSSVKPTV